MNSEINNNLEMQLAEIEMLKSMFPEPGELRIDDPNALLEIQDYICNLKPEIPPYIDLTINLIIKNNKFELCVNLTHEYPKCEPDLYVRNHQQSKSQHAKLNKDLNEYVASLDRGDPCIYSIILWLQDNASNYIEEFSETKTMITKENDELVRLWIYSHHIYSKTKRKEILHIAQTLGLTGFCMPGKPGIICIEGNSTDCYDCWQSIKSMTWKRIFCKVTEECNEEESTFKKFHTFEEVAFQNSGNRCNHMDIGELSKYLESHGCTYIFKELFGVEAKPSN